MERRDTVAYAQDKQNKELPLIDKWLHSASRGLKLHGEPLSVANSLNQILFLYLSFGFFATCDKWKTQI